VELVSQRSREWRAGYAAWAGAALVALASCDGESPPEARLEVAGAAGERVVLSWTDLRALPSTEGLGGAVNTVGSISPPAQYAGVAVEALADLVGGLGASSGARVAAGDGYAVTLSAAQVLSGDYELFDPDTGAPVASAGRAGRAVVALERAGRTIPAGDGGPLRLVVLNDEGLLTPAHLWVKQVATVEVVPVEEDWALHLEGARTDEIGRTFFEAGSAPGCHRSAWTDAEGRVWTGIALWLLVGWVDDENAHRAGGFDRALAAAGYGVEVRARGGGTVVLSSARLAAGDVLLADRVDGEPLGADDFPLRLVGAGLAAGEAIGRVEAVSLRLP
jgi:DMSO/TMAO reductase YedYZ molybdopterin-dependent catalytic subunit